MANDAKPKYFAPAANAAMPARGRIAARTVGSYVPKLTRKAFEKYGFSAAALLTDWETIVGKEIAGYAMPERLKWPRSVGYSGDVEPGAEGRPGAKLVVRVDPAHALEVEYQGAQILERINAYFGYRAVAEMRIVQAPLTVKAAAAPQALPIKPAAPRETPELQAIPDEGLRAALMRLQSALESRASTA